MGSLYKAKMKLFGAFFLASANAEGRGACMAQVRETIAANPVINGEWDCERTGKDAVNCSVKCNSGKIHGKNPFIKAKFCDKEDGKFKTNVEGEELECDDGPEFKCASKSKELLETIGGGDWTCKEMPGAKYRCKGSCWYQTQFLGNSSKYRYIHMSDCRSDEPKISYENFNGEPLACKSKIDWCDEKTATIDIANGSMVGNGRFYNPEYYVTCADGRRVAKYACADSSYFGFPFFRTRYGPWFKDLNKDTICATNCNPSASELNEMYPIGAGQWNCELNKKKLKYECKATCDHGPKRLGFILECGSITNDQSGWKKNVRDSDGAQTCDAAED